MSKVGEKPILGVSDYICFCRSQNKVKWEDRFTPETKMTQNELLAAIEALPKELQFALATSVLDRLAAEGPWPVSEQLQTGFLQREQAFFAEPSKGESWEVVREELFGK
jgi:hypothetical protein